MTTTPCQEAPEAWVGKDAGLRAEAARICRDECPYLAQCKAGTFPFVKPRPDDHGVWAGIDHNPPTKTGGRECNVCGNVNYPVKGRAPRTCPGCIETKVCEHCEGEYPRTYHSPSAWKRSRFCSSVCGGLGSRKDVA